MARRSSAATAETFLPDSRRNLGLGRALRQVTTAMLVLAAILAAIWLYVSIESFLVTDSRFFLPGPPEPGEQSDFFRIEGARNVTDEQVRECSLATSAGAFISAVARAPAETSGHRLGEGSVDKSALAESPVIRLKERTPVAFAQMPATDGTTSCSRWWTRMASCWIRNALDPSSFLC